MRKSLLLVAAFGIVMSASAQSNLRRVMQTTKETKIARMTKAPVMLDSKKQPVAISKLTSANQPEVSVKRPGGVLWGGMVADVAASSYSYALLAIPAYSPVTFGVSKDEDITDGKDSYWLGVPYFDAATGTFDYCDNQAGEDVETIFLPSIGQYPSPMASVVYNGGVEVVSYLVNGTEANDGSSLNPMISVGFGVGPFMQDDGTNSMSLGNYDCHWDGGASYSKNYSGTNMALPGWEQRFASQGASNFRMIGFMELFDAPAAPFWVSGVTMNAIVQSQTCGNVNVAIVKMEANEQGQLGMSDVLATSVCAGPTDTYNGWSVFSFTELKDTTGNVIEGLTMNAGEAFALYFFLDENDNTTQLCPLTYTHKEYMANEAHAYAEYTYDMQGESGYGGVFDCNFAWFANEEGTEFNYQTSWMCGLVAEYPYLHLIDDEANNGGMFYTDLAGGEMEFGIESLYTLFDEPEFKNVEATLENGEPLPDWITVKYQNYADEEGNFNGVVGVVITVAPSTQTYRDAKVKITNMSASLVLDVIQSDPTGIADVKVNTEKKDHSAAYNMAGQKVSSGYRGLVIKNGVKYMKK